MPIVCAAFDRARRDSLQTSAAFSLEVTSTKSPSCFSAEFLEENNVAVVGLAEGSWLHVDGDRVTLGGAAGARVFQRDKPRIEFDPGADLTFVMSAPATFDNLDSAASVHA